MNSSGFSEGLDLDPHSSNLLSYRELRNSDRFFYSAVFSEGLDSNPYSFNMLIYEEFKSSGRFLDFSVFSDGLDLNPQSSNLLSYGEPFFNSFEKHREDLILKTPGRKK